MRNPRRVHPLVWLLLIVVPALVRLAPIEHGKPDNYLPDTHVVRNALGMAKDRTLIPPSGKYSTYPYLLPYVLLPVYAGQYALGRIEGEWKGSGEFGNRIMEDPWRVHLPARIALALLASLAPLWVFLGLRRAGLGVGALGGAFFMATCLLHVHHSTQERPWASLVMLLMGCAWSCAAFVQSGRYRHLVASGVWAGLAVACHQGGLPAVLMPALAWVWAPHGWRARELRTRLRFGLLCASAFLIVAVLLGNPYLLVHGWPKGDAVVMNEALQGTTHFTLGGQSTVFGFRLASFQHLARTLVGYDPAIVVLGLAGLVLALRNRPARPVVVFALLWGAYWMTNVNDHVRYLLPLAAGLTWAVGFACEWGWKRPWARAIVVGLGLLTCVQAARFALVMNRTDTRGLIQEQLLAMPGPMDIAVDLGGPDLPLDAASLERLAGLRGLYAREAHRRELLEAGVVLRPSFAALPLEAVVQLDRRHHGSWLTDSARARYGEDLKTVLAHAG
ncbi:MAG TPA: glycosyltransferase family 39 protein, partial [Planctomycetota bacterium]|nr:glycosyltransferase family 39 protein [Planctomycetota bacterium]